MRIPFKYNLRSLGRRKTRTLLTVLGVAFVTVVAVLMSALVHSMWDSIRNNGSPDNVILLSRKAQNAIFSSIKAQDHERLVDVEHIKMDDTGVFLVSPEIMVGAPVTVKGDPALRRVTVRGVEPADNLAFLVNDTVRVRHFRINLYDEDVEYTRADDGSVRLTVKGEEGTQEFEAPSLADFRKTHEEQYMTYVVGSVPERDGGILLGKMAHIKLGLAPEDVAVGKSLWWGDTEWRIVGTFDAPGSSFEAETWAHVGDCLAWFDRTTYSQITVKADEPGNVEALLAAIRGREDVQLNAEPEQAFYAAYSENFNIFRGLILVIAVILAVGGVFAGMNTMYAAVMGRIREIGTLKVLGFPRTSIFLTVLTESMLMALAGGVLGAAVAWGLSILLSEGGGLGIPIKISMNAFLVQVQWPDTLYGLAAAVMIGLVGALLPAVRGIRMSIVDALRWT